MVILFTYTVKTDWKGLLMLIKDYSGKDINADAVYAIPTKYGSDYVKLDVKELQKYAMVNRRSYADVLASATMVNVSE